jgi:alpha-1,2-mannosyltransferase
LVWRILLPMNRFAAVFGGLFYGVFYPAVVVAHTTLMEAPQNLVLLLGVWIISRQLPAQRLKTWHRPAPWLLAGLAIGLSPGLKIWGVVAVLLVAVWVLASFGWRRLVQVLAGVAVTGLAVHLPFFLHAPETMWRYVVLDQLGRGSFSTSPILRLKDIAGLHALGSQPLPTWSFWIVASCWVAALALACTISFGRVAACFHVAFSAFLLTTPTWLPHYAGFTAATAALVMGSAVVAIHTVLRRPVLQRIGATAAIVIVLASATGLAWVHFGARFPSAELASVRSASGCVTADDPTTLIRLDLLDRNLEHGCRLVVDLGGYTYDQLVAGKQRSRINNPGWQRTALDYLGSGSASVISRFTTPRYESFTKKSLETLSGWNLVLSTGHYVVRIPN